MYLSETLADYRQDFEELHFLLTDSTSRLKRFLTDIQKTKKHIARSTYEEVAATASQYIDSCRVQDRLVMKQHDAILRHSPDEKFFMEAENVKKSAYEFLRTHQSIFGALITCTDWQSPSFLHTFFSQAGRQTNRIYATINDYKRDQHWDAHQYEEVFRKTNIDGLIKFPIQVCATNSGMAAFATILNFLTLEKKATRPVLIGKSVYFENKALALQAFGKKIIEVDESQTDAIIRTIDTHNPSIVIFDSLANSPDIAVPNLSAITRHLVSHSKKETYLIVDNTCLSVMFQPFPMFFAKRTNLRLIMFESLNKYHQFGMDRVVGGILWGYGGDTGKLFDYRVHLGTNISDLTVASLPTPNRIILERRLRRHQRNATLLATALQSFINANPSRPFSKIVFPGLPNHPSYSWMEKSLFYGSFITIQFNSKHQNIASYKRFVNTVIQEAKRHHIDLISGTSFGMNTTRIYLTAIRSKPNIPFIRIAVGSESRRAIEAVKIVLLQSFSRFR